MFKLGNSFIPPKEPSHKDKHYLVFMKRNFTWMIYVEMTENFRTLYEILKGFCVLSNFSADYEILEFLGRGHFAEVYSVSNLSTNKKYAAKIFEKETEKFQKNSVIK